MHLYEGFRRLIALSGGVQNPSLCVIHTLQSRITSNSHATIEACRKLLRQSPDLVHIFQAGRLLPASGPYWTGHFEELFTIRNVLDLLWDDIQKSICSLRPFATQDPDFFYTLFLCLPSLVWELDSLSPRTLVSRDLAYGFLRLMQRIENGDLPKSFWFWLPDYKEWGQHVRTSPPSDPELIQTLYNFLPAWEIFSYQDGGLEPVEFYDVVQWLKTSPNLQPNLIERWQDYLVKSLKQAGQIYSDDRLEKRWQDYSKRKADFHGPPHESDKEVIQCWEGCLSKLRGTSSL
ncbi:hypothetical protein B0H13DRAFT_2012085 [Mycena leptocephala]|nr:hypothetical protein B0H13DRAFT_2012085 [Mycena leptocephala]